MSNKLVLNSRAKINIGLKIINKRPDGIHNIQTIFQEVKLHDTITLEKLDSACTFTSNVNWLDNSMDNLCVKAFNLMLKNYNIGGLAIKLNKIIPPGGGLGGGSSNAATVIKGLNLLYNLNISTEELESLCSQIGADVPFFVRGGIQLGEGTGGKLTKVSKKLDGFLLLVIPPFQISTSWAYRKTKRILEEVSKNVNFKCLIEKENISFKFFENDFESIIDPSYPEIGVIKDTLRAHNARYASLSGSGSTVYAIFDDEADAKSAELHFNKSHITFITSPYNEG